MPLNSFRIVGLAALLLSGSLILSRPLAAQIDGRVTMALSAAPVSIADSATVMDWDQTVLRQGTNDWTCLPDSPDTTALDPMCLDEPSMDWLRAYLSKTSPSVARMGFGYMLAGDAGASNTDPFATAQAPDNEWVFGSPHIMIVVPDPAALSGVPTAPSGGPWVMWRDTPFVHLMIPVADPGQILMTH